jgi:hypothetical protein
MKVYKLNKVIFGFLAACIFIAGITAVSCNQGPIFYTISTETVPQPPLVRGAPTNMVVFEREDPANPSEKIPIMYVASGNQLFWYAKGQYKKAYWNLFEYTIYQPGGTIIGLATTQSYLYALCLNGHGLDTTLWRIGHKGIQWEMVNNIALEYPLVQSIYADPETDRLFAGAGKNDKDKATYAILYLDDDTTANKTLKLLKDDTKILSGAAFQDNVYYLSTRGAGIYAQGAGDTVSQLTDGSVYPFAYRTFMGIIKLKNSTKTIIAVERDGGSLYEVEGSSFKPIKYLTGAIMMTERYATGAMAIWEGMGKKMLIVGKQGGLYNTTSSSYTHGYVEFPLGGDGSLDKSKLRNDPGFLASVFDQDRYRASLGKHPINYLYQAPNDIDTNMTFFASTQTVGLWSYKDRPNDGGWQWNAEN